jgi:predicted DNA-binding transcriptional regulator AlpA
MDVFRDEVGERALTRDQVLELVGVSSASLRRYVRAGKFPAPRIIGIASQRWLRSDIAAWLRARPLAGAKS